MKRHHPEPRPLEHLDELVQLCNEAAALRRQAAGAILAGRPLTPDILPALAQILADLEEAEDRDELVELALDEDQSMRLDLAEETRQLENDLIYLEEGRDALMRHLARQHRGMHDAVRKALKELTAPSFGVLLCDFDAAIRAPRQRFVTAFQPAWNAVALSRFAMARTRRAVLWSQAPLSGPGITELATVPERTFAFAASLGRHYRNAAGEDGASPLSPAKAELLETINARLAVLLADPSWRSFAFVGSGLQFRRGETVLARQDAAGSVDEDISLGLLEHVHDIVDGVDPEREHFRVEDDGLDVAVTPTVVSQDVWREFSPAEGLRLTDAALGLDFGTGPHVVCCGGAPGIELLEALLALSADVRCLFVTDREELGRRARELCPHIAVLPHPDVAAAVFSAAAP